MSPRLDRALRRIIPVVIVVVLAGSATVLVAGDRDSPLPPRDPEAFVKDGKPLTPKQVLERALAKSRSYKVTGSVTWIGPAGARPISMRVTRRVDARRDISLTRQQLRSADDVHESISIQHDGKIYVDSASAAAASLPPGKRWILMNFPPGPALFQRPQAGEVPLFGTVRLLETERVRGREVRRYRWTMDVEAMNKARVKKAGHAAHFMEGAPASRQSDVYVHDSGFVVRAVSTITASDHFGMRTDERFHDHDVPVRIALPRPHQVVKFEDLEQGRPEDQRPPVIPGFGPP